MICNSRICCQLCWNFEGFVCENVLTTLPALWWTHSEFDHQDNISIRNGKILTFRGERNTLRMHTWSYSNISPFSNKAIFFVNFLLRRKYFSTHNLSILMPETDTWSYGNYFVIWQKLLIFTFYLKTIWSYSLKVADYHYLYYNQQHVALCAIQHPTFSGAQMPPKKSLLSASSMIKFCQTEF